MFSGPCASPYFQLFRGVTRYWSASQFLERNYLRAPVEHLCHVLTVVGADVKRKIANAQLCGVEAKRADLPKFGMTPLRDPSAVQREPTMHGRLHVARNGQ